MKTLYILAVAASAAAVIPVLHAQTAPAGISGRWIQTSSGKELVLAPRIKLVPNVGVTPGTNLGGTVGYGSMTRTTIVTEPTMMQVARSMTLAIAADGQFKWTVVKRHAENEACTITKTQVKQGRVSQAGAKLTFAVEGGTDSFASSCGKRGNSQLGKSTEHYTLQQSGGRMVLAGGASRWTFSRG